MYFITIKKGENIERNLETFKGQKFIPYNKPFIKKGQCVV